jgi:very-short-patch-repair endonuclease
MHPPPSPWVGDLATIDALVAAGLKRRTVRRRISVGRWSEPLPGVACRTTGDLNDDQRLTGALLYAGAGSMLSCATAGVFWGLGRASHAVHVATSHGRNIRSTPEVTVHQTKRPCEPRLVQDWLVTPPSRTAIDIALELHDIDAVRSVLGRAVQSNRSTPVQLGDELDLAPKHGSLLPRVALEEIALGAHAASEARLVRLILRTGLAAPEYNAAVQTSAGTKYVDALWRSRGKGVEIDGRAFHLGPTEWAADLARQNAIQTCGIVLLRIPAYRLWREPAAVISEITAFLNS